MGEATTPMCGECLLPRLGGDQHVCRPGDVEFVKEYRAAFGVPSDPYATIQNLRAKLQTAEEEPCAACGQPRGVDPPSGEELPIIRGALDAQAEVEKRAYALEEERDRLREALEDALGDLDCYAYNPDTDEYDKCDQCGGSPKAHQESCIVTFIRDALNPQEPKP